MRAYLSELGCLPVSAMIHVPHAGDVFDAEGRVAEGQDAARWSKYLGRTFNQLIWWAEAARAQRDIAEGPEAFRRDPRERDAP